MPHWLRTQSRTRLQPSRHSKPLGYRDSHYNARQTRVLRHEAGLATIVLDAIHCFCSYTYLICNLATYAAGPRRATRSGREDWCGVPENRSEKLQEDTRRRMEVWARDNRNVVHFCTLRGK